MRERLELLSAILYLALIIWLSIQMLFRFMELKSEDVMNWNGRYDCTSVEVLNTPL